MSEGLYVETQRFVNALMEGETVKAREIMKNWPKASFMDLLNLITQVTLAMSEDDEEEFMFNQEVSKALMILSCKHPKLGNVWNAAIHDDVPIHFDNYKPFLTACQSGNLDMVKDFRRFQYDEEDGSKMIPDNIWVKGATAAKKSGEDAVYVWITKYLESGTDDEDDTSTISSQSDDYNDCQGNENGEGDEDCDEFEDEDEIYEETRKRLKEKRAQERAAGNN